MKKFYYLFLFFFTAWHMSAQTNFTQNGVVRELNSGKKGVGNVQIIFSNAAPSASDTAGKFRLAFSNQKIGDIAFCAEIAKKGYELVNAKALEPVKLGKESDWQVDIVVAKSDELAAVQKNCYTHLDATLFVSLRRQKDRLLSELQGRLLKKKEYQEQYDALQKHYSHQKKILGSFAEKMAKVNFDDVPAVYQEILQLVKEEKLEDAIAQLERTGLVYHIHTTVKSVLPTKNPQDSMRQKAERDNSVRADMVYLNLQADLYRLDLRLDKGEALYDQIVFADSTNLDILRGAADFYKTNQYYEKALTVYPKIIAHAKTDAIQKNQAFQDAGDALTAIGQFEEAGKAYTQAKVIMTTWLRDHPNTPFAKHLLAVIYAKLGTIEMSLGNADKAMIFFKSTNRFAQEIFDIYPNSIVFKNSLALSFEKLGKISVNFGDLPKGISFYETSLRLRKELYMSDASNLDYKNAWAVACENLGNTLMNSNAAPKALPFFEQNVDLRKEMQADDHFNIELKTNLAAAQSKLGATYSTLGNVDKALIAFADNNRLSKEVAIENVSNSTYKNAWAVSCSKLAEAYLALGKNDKAIALYEERLKINLELTTTLPNNVAFKNNLSVTYAKLGNLYANAEDLDKALEFYEKDVDLSKELYTSNPTNSYFKNNLAIAYSKIGTFFKEKKNDKSQAVTYYEQCKALFSELVTTTPTSVDYKNSLKWAEEKLAEK
jgi:tetratricopeptide (TPR) repeat protein